MPTLCPVKEGVKKISSFVTNFKNAEKFQKGGALAIAGIGAVAYGLLVAGEVKSRKEIKKEENNIA